MFNTNPKGLKKMDPKTHMFFVCFQVCYLWAKLLCVQVQQPFGALNSWHLRDLCRSSDVPKTVFFSLEVVGHPKDDDIPRKEVGCLDFVG